MIERLINKTEPRQTQNERDQKGFSQHYVAVVGWKGWKRMLEVLEVVKGSEVQIKL